MYYTYRDANFPLIIQPFVGAANPLTPALVSVSLLKPGTSVFVDFEFNLGSLTEPSDFKHVEGNWYTFKLPGNLLTTFGNYIVKLKIVDDPVTQNLLGIAYFELLVYESDRRSAAVPVDETCLLVGNVKDVDGRIPKWNDIEASYRPVVFPQIHGSAALTSSTVTTRTDVDGHFEMPCVRGALISFEIPKCGIRFQYTVPYDLDVVNMIDVFNTMLQA